MGKLAIVCVMAVVLWGGNWFLLSRFMTDQAARGQFGDVFCAVNALFIALAFAGLLYAVLMQRDQLALQQQAMAESGQAQAQLVQIQIDAQNELFERQKAFQEEQRQAQIKHEMTREQLRQDFEESAERRGKDREKQARHDFAKNVVRAIRCELEALSGLYRKEMDRKLEELKDDDILRVRFTLTEDWLTVFTANAAHLGAINGDLSRRIITVYSLVKGLIEEYRINNSYLVEIERLETARLQSPTDPFLQVKHQALLRLAQSQAKEIKAADAALKAAYADLMAVMSSEGIA